MKAGYFTEFGGPEVLQYGTVADPKLTTTGLIVKTQYIGLNYADIYRRRGTYHLEKQTPYIDGYEGIGEVVACGTAVQHVKEGDRVLFVDVPFANAELVAVPEARAIHVPAAISDQVAAAIGLQGLTADFLAHDLAQNQAGDRVLIHGISGGVGNLLTQLLTADGVSVDGVASTTAKQQLAYAAGAHEVFLRHSDWAATHANYFDTVFDGVGSTLPISLAITRRRGRIVFYGMAGDLWDFLTGVTVRQARADRLFKAVLRQTIVPTTPTIYPLSAISTAHTALEQGQVAGKILLAP